MPVANATRLYTIALLADVPFLLFPFIVTRLLAEQAAGMTAAGILAAICTLGYGVCTSFSGRLADRFGHRTVIAAGGFLGAGVMALALLAPAPAAAPAAYCLLIGGLGAAIGLIYPPVIAALTAGQPDAARPGILLRFCLAWNVGIMLGQLGGGGLLSVVAEPAARLAGFGLCSAALLAIGVLAVTLPGHASGQDGPVAAPPAAPTLAPAARQRALWFAWLGWVGLFAASFTIAVVTYLLPTLAVQLGLPPGVHGLMLAGNRLVSLAVYILLSLTCFWHYRLTTNLAGLLCNLLAMALLAAVSAHGLVIFAVALNGVMMGTLYFVSIYYATTAYRDRDKGRAGGIHESVIALGLTVGGLVGGLAGDRYGIRAPFVAALLLTAASGLAQVALFVRYRRQAAEAPTAG